MSEPNGASVPASIQGLVKKVDHIGIAVRDADLVAASYAVLGLAPAYEEISQEQGVRTVFIEIGETHLELLQPLREDTPVGKFLAGHGEGLHHLCLEVSDLAAALVLLVENGYRLIDREPRRGVRNRMIAFVHPHSVHGVLLELAMPLSAESYSISDK